MPSWTVAVARRDAAVAAVDLDGRQLCPGSARSTQKPEVAETALVACHAGDDGVVVLARLSSRCGCVLLAVDLSGEVVEGAGVRARAEERQLLVGEESDRLRSSSSPWSRGPRIVFS
mgnify:CR=1 FL=1